MIVGQRGSLVAVLRWQSRSIVLFMVSAAVTVCLREFAGWHWLVLPTTPLAVVGGALGIFVSFRANAAYNRWWEGRQLWGKLVNASRMWSTQVLGYLPRGEDGKPSELQSRLVTQQVLYVHLLRCLLRLQDPRKDEDVIRYSSDEERARITKQSNPTHALLHEMHAALTAEADAGRLDGLRLQSLDATIMTFLDVQGGCERIKKTPMPRCPSTRSSVSRSSRSARPVACSRIPSRCSGTACRSRRSRAPSRTTSASGSAPRTCSQRSKRSSRAS